MTKEFKKNLRGAYELHINKKFTGVSFFIPNGFKIEDYADKIEYIGNSQSNNICFRITSSPSQFEKAHIESINEINFKDGLVVNVAENIYIGLSKNVSLCADTSGKSLSFDSFILRSNQDTTFNFSSELAKEDRKSKDEVEKDFTVTGTTNGIFNLRDDIEHLTLQNSFFMKTYPTDPIMGDSNSVTFNSKNVSFGQGQFYFVDAQSSIDFSSDEIDIKETYLEVKNGKTTIAQTGKDFSTLVMIEAQFIGGLTRLFTKDPSSSSYGSDEVHSLVTNSPRLHFNPNSSTSLLYENKIVSEGDIAFSSKKSNALASISLDFEGKGVELGKNEIINTTISFSSDKKGSKSSKYLLTENTFVDVEVENLVAFRVQKWKVRDLKATSITSGLNASLLTDGVKLEAQNLVLEKGSSLSLTVNSRKDWQCSLSNSIIKGKNMLEGKGEINIRNSVLEDATLINNNHEKKKLTISDSELKGYNRVENIKEIACSSVADSSLISSGEPKTIRDKLLEQVSNLDLFLKSENAEASVITNFDDKLELL